MVGFDTLKDCSKCGSDACYIKEVSTEVTIEWCFGCGFVSNTLLRRGELFFEEQMEIMPELNKFLMVEEENGKMWMPSFVHVVDKGMVFANGSDPKNWKWGSVKSIPIDEEEMARLNTKETFKADFASLKEFEERDYIEALDYIGILGEELI